MPETVNHPTNLPEAPYPGEPLLPEHATPGDGKTRLEEKARQVGFALGKAVVALKGIGEQGRETATSTARQASNRMTGIAGSIRQKTAEWGEAAADTAEELRQAATEKARDLRSQVKSGYYRTRLQANRAVREYPVHLVLIAGAVGFLLGVGLRIWRSNREY